MRQTTLTDAEEKSLVGILYNHISFASSMEVFGELEANGLNRLAQLRSLFVKLLQKYSLTKALSPENYLLLGITKHLNKAALEKWGKNNKNKHLQNRAIYYLKKNYDEK